MKIDLIKPSDLADRWNLNQKTLAQWRWNGRGPAFLKIGKRVMYRTADVECFEANRLKISTSSISNN